MQDAYTMGELNIEVADNCRMCGVCVRSCLQRAIAFEQKSDAIDKGDWRDFLIYVEQERGDLHSVAYELIGKARKLAAKVGYRVNCVLVGGTGTAENGSKLLPYGVDEVFVHEDAGFEGFRADCYADAVADCIAHTRPSSALIGATALGRSLAPRLSTWFHTGLTADCTSLDIQPSTDMVQIRPAFGGNIMAQILITHSRPQFATVRYRVMDRAARVAQPTGKVTLRRVPRDMTRSGITVLASILIEKMKTIEEAERIVAVAGTSGTRMGWSCAVSWRRPWAHSWPSLGPW